MELCPCSSGKKYSACCEPYLNGDKPAPTAEALMRSRYSAYAKKKVSYLTETLHPDQRHDHDEQSAKEWAESSEWLGMEVKATKDGLEKDDKGMVEFLAKFKYQDAERAHHEVSQFVKEGGRWFYVDGKIVGPGTYIRPTPKVGRNDPCSCGSGKKFKKCCGAAAAA